MIFKHKDHRLLSEFLTSTRISEVYTYELLRELDITPFETERGTAIKKSDYDIMISVDNFKKYYTESLKFGIRRYNEDQDEEVHKCFEEQINTKIGIIKKYTNELGDYHKQIAIKFDVVNDETAECASCILFTKAINMFNAVILCIENKFLCSNIFFRPINEAINLAEYFLLIKEETNGNKSLRDWFRDNKTPSTDSIVSSLKKYSQKYTDARIAHIYSSMIYELSQSTSKPIHNSYSDSLKHFLFDIENDTIITKDLELYGTTNTRELLEYTNYLFTLLLSIHLTYLNCFELLIQNTDKEILSKIEKNRQELDSINTDIRKTRID